MICKRLYRMCGICISTLRSSEFCFFDREKLLFVRVHHDYLGPDGFVTGRNRMWASISSTSTLIGLFFRHDFVNPKRLSVYRTSILRVKNIFDKGVCPLSLGPSILVGKRAFLAGFEALMLRTLNDDCSSWQEKSQFMTKPGPGRRGHERQPWSSFFWMLRLVWQRVWVMQAVVVQDKLALSETDCNVPFDRMKQAIAA